MIINLRGNNGSGKSTVARAFRDSGTKIEELVNAAGKTWGYKFYLRGCRAPWILLGRYTTACGGVDTFKDAAETLKALHEAIAVRKCNVFLEGVLMSDFYGAVGTYSEQFGTRWVFAYMDTPIEVCLQRIQARRKAAGNNKLFDPARKLYPRHKSIARSRLNIEQNYKRRTVTVSYINPLPALLKLARKEG